MKNKKSSRSSSLGKFGAFWGIVGLSLLFSRALFALSHYVPEMRGTPDHPVELHWYHWAALGVCLLFMGYAEGYKGFQLKFSPRAAARALYLKRNPTIARVIFAPLFCMGYFHATRKRKIVSYSITCMIIGLIIGVHHTTQPWHGIIDAGVLFGLGWGMITVWIFAFKAFFGPGFDISPETPDA